MYSKSSMYRDNKANSRSIDICSKKLRTLKIIFSEFFIKIRLVFYKLILLLGNSIVSDKERFGLSWSGKADCFKIIQNPTNSTLRSYYEQSIDFDTTQNPLIQSSTLEVLRLLQKYILVIK